MSSSEKEKLLNDLLRDANYEAFRKDVRELSIAEFRGAHRPRSRMRWLALAAAIVLIGSALFFSIRPSKPGTVMTEREGLDATRMADSVAKPEVSSDRAASAFQNDQQPLFVLIRSKELQPVEVVRSLPDLTLLVSTPVQAARAVEVVHSDRATVNFVSDDEFIALFPPDTIGFFNSLHGKRLVIMGNPDLTIGMPSRN